jgi:glycerate 2-kinase
VTLDARAAVVSSRTAIRCERPQRVGRAVGYRRGVRRDPGRDDLLADALAVAHDSLESLDLRGLIEDRLADTIAPDARDGPVDVVAIGKAAAEMAAATVRALGPRAARVLVVSEEGSSADLVGDHPRPKARSAAAGRAILGFLDASNGGALTIFLVSGGASSLAVAPVAPVSVRDLGALFDAATSRGATIGTLNRLRAAVSWLGGGAVLSRVRTHRSIALIAVDVLEGAAWVASALTYDYRPGPDEVRALLAEVGLGATDLGERVLAAAVTRVASLGDHAAHDNAVVVEPAHWLAAARVALRRRGYRVIDLGAALEGDVESAAHRFLDVLARADDGPVALLGVGELTVALAGATGRGGRCQEWAARVGLGLASAGRAAVALGVASDGRDRVEGVAGAWCTDQSIARARTRGLDPAGLIERHDTFTFHEALDELVPGAHTGWNLCDLYVVLAGRRSSGRVGPVAG